MGVIYNRKATTLTWFIYLFSAGFYFSSVSFFSCYVYVSLSFSLSSGLSKHSTFRGVLKVTLASGEMAHLYFDIEENSTRTLMDGPDLALPGMSLMCVCMCVYTHISDLWQQHDKAIDPDTSWSVSLSVCVCAWATLCICLCVHVFVNASLLFQERFTDLYTTSGLNPDSYSWRLTLWQSSSKVEKLSALEVFGSFFCNISQHRRLITGRYAAMISSTFEPHLNREILKVYS